MDDEEESPLVIAQRFALQAEQYAAKGQYTKAIDRHTRAARHFQLCIGATSDRAANDALVLLLAGQIAAIENIRKRLYGPAFAVTAAATPSAALLSAPAPAPAAGPAAAAAAAAAAGLAASVTSSLVLGTPPKAPAASPAPPPPVSLDATAAPDTASSTAANANTGTSSGMSLALDTARTLQLRRALDALVLAAATDDQSVSLDAVRNADALKAFGTELRTRLSAEEDALSRALHSPLLRTAGANAPATPVPGAVVAAATPTPTGAVGSSTGGADAAHDMAAMAAALSALRAQVFQLSVNETAAALENAALKQRVTAFQQRTKESQRLLYGALTGLGAAPAPGSVAAGSVLCASDVCAAEKKKLRDRLAAVSAELSSETALRQKQSALLDTYQTKLKRYEEKWDKLKAQAHASASAKLASLTSPAAAVHGAAVTSAGSGAATDPATTAATAAAAVAAGRAGAGR